MINARTPRFRRSVRLLVAAAVVTTAAMVPVLPGNAAPTPVVIPITEGGLGVNGTVLTIPAVAGAQLAGTYDPDTGAFSGSLVVPSFTLSGTTSVSDAFTLTFSAVDAPVTGTIPQTGSGTLGPVGWTVGIALPDLSITDCSVTIAPLALTTTFSAETGALALTAVSYPIPESTCTNAGDEPTVDAVLAIPTTVTVLGLLAADASALRPPAPEPEPEPQPTFTG
jgi:hypothetical protein